MLDQYVMTHLRKAERVFMKRGQPNLASCARAYRGHLVDCALTGPNDTLMDNVNNCLNLAFGGTIHV